MWWMELTIYWFEEFVKECQVFKRIILQVLRNIGQFKKSHGYVGIRYPIIGVMFPS